MEQFTTDTVENIWEKQCKKNRQQRMQLQLNNPKIHMQSTITISCNEYFNIATVFKTINFHSTTWTKYCNKNNNNYMNLVLCQWWYKHSTLSDIDRVLPQYGFSYSLLYRCGVYISTQFRSQFRCPDKLQEVVLHQWRSEISNEYS